MIQQLFAVEIFTRELWAVATGPCVFLTSPSGLWLYGRSQSTMLSGVPNFKYSFVLCLKGESQNLCFWKETHFIQHESKILLVSHIICIKNLPMVVQTIAWLYLT